jgi:CBS domain-containing protein
MHSTHVFRTIKTLIRQEVNIRSEEVFMGKTKNLKKDFPSVLDIAYKRHLRDLSRYKEVKAIMSKDVATITPETSMEDAAKIMGEKHVGSLIVTKYETPVGIITERDLLTEVLAKGRELKEEKVENVMSYPLISICMTAKIKEAARIMIKKKGRLAVFECGKLVGIVTASDLIRSLPDVPETEIKVDNFMTKQLVTADEKQPLGKVVKTMGEQRIGSVIVTRKTEPIGIFTERDLLTTILATGKSLSTLVGDHSSSPLVTVDEGTSIHRAAVTMKMKHIRRLPIIRGEKLTGIITARDLVEAYAK